MWQKLKDTLFQPPETRWLAWLGVTPLFVLASAIFALLAFSPFHAIVLLLALFANLIFWRVAANIGVITIVAVVAFALFCFPSERIWWNACWLVSLVSGLMVTLFVIPEARRFFQARGKRIEEFAKDAELWQHRFTTMKEKLDEDRRLWEGEIELLRKEIEEKKSHVNSLKTLLEVIHRESAQAAKRIQELKERAEPEDFEIEGKVITKEEVGRIVNDLNFYRTQHYQVNQLLTEATEKLKMQEAAIQERQKRNQSLLGTNAKKSISLKDLAKKV